MLRLRGFQVHNHKPIGSTESEMIPAILRKILDGVMLFLLSALSLLIVYGIVTGLPITIGGWVYKGKSFKTLCLIALALWALHCVLDAEGPKRGFLKFKNRLEQAAQNPFAVWIVFVVAGVFFTWQQVA
jgi:hypothetical protein